LNEKLLFRENVEQDSALEFHFAARREILST